MEIRPEVMVTIAGMALVTYATRAGGLALVSRVKLSRPVERWLNQLPGAVLMALIVPEVFKSGWPGLIAGLITAGVAVRSRNLLLAMLVGIGAIVVIRWLIGG
jgi:uncharacterized membrane protein